MQEIGKPRKPIHKWFQLRSMGWPLSSQKFAFGGRAKGFVHLSGGLDFYFPPRALVAVGFAATR
jgi:hypothetical protein